jgi:CBS domain containing-hemolysin-like protein
MNISILQLLILIIPVLVVEGFFSGSEIALLSADKIHLKKQSKAGLLGAELALALSNHPERVFSTTLLISSLCVITISTLVSLFFLEQQVKYPNLYAILFTSPLVVLFGELIPKTIYQRHSRRLAPWVAYPIFWTYWILYPITRLIAYYTTRLSRLIGPLEEIIAGKQRTTREDIRALLSYSQSESEIKSTEKTMIRRIFDFKDTEAKNALLPLVKVDAISNQATIQDALISFEKHRHSRMPVYSERIDNIVGVLENSDLLAANDLNESIDLYISPAHYAAETQSLEDLMHDMRSEDSEMVVVVDEHGGAVGILTFEDIVEEIVGEISDEFDFETLSYKQLSEISWSVQAKMEIQQINEILKIDLPQGNYETLSGFLLQQFGRIPEPRDELFFDTPTGYYKFMIQSATERHIELVLIEKIK